MHQPSLSPELAPEDRAQRAPLADAGGGAPATVAPTGKVFCRDLADGTAVETVFLVRECSRRQKRNGESFLKLRLGDVTGVVEAVVWDEVEETAAAAAPGEVVVVRGLFERDRRYGPSLTVRSLRRAGPDDYDPRDVMDGPAISYERMVADLRELVATIQDRHLAELLARLLGANTEVGRRWREAPAAKHYHQAYRHGLLEHCLAVAQGVSALAATFPDIDRDVAVAGALLHDIGKIEAYEMDRGAIELSDAGRLEGEIPLGYFFVRREIEAMGGFPEHVAQALLHIILSHHGLLEHGSPVIPCTREATLVHMVDNLGGRLGSFDRIEKGLQDGERWSQFDRALSGPAYFGPRAAA
jgi:3'-5' exoribonuclease